MPNTASAPVVQVENLYRFYGVHCAVNNLSFTLAKGEVLGLLGPNGAGKTSTLQMLAGNLAPSGGRILIDTARNGYSATFAAAYAVRPKPGAPVSAPCTWEELAHGKAGPQTFTLRTMAARISETGDLWADLHRSRQSLKAAAGQLPKKSSL